MRNRLTLAASCGLLSLAFTGCHGPISKDIRYVITSDTAARTVTVTCEKSISGKCHFTFSGDAPARGDISVGNTLTFRDIAPGTHYCAESFSAALPNCKPGPLPAQRSTVTKRVEMSEDAGG